MKRIKPFLTLLTQFLTKYPRTSIRLSSLFYFFIFLLVIILIWTKSPYLLWNEQTPFSSPEKRIYLILALLLLWLLKVLISHEFITPPTPHPRHPLLKEKWLRLRKRLNGVMSFLNKTSINKQGKSVKLSTLPWYLMIGPEKSGKTSLLAHSQAPFILQRRASAQENSLYDINKIEPSETCDWWVTKEAALIDVPSQYWQTLAGNPSQKKEGLWQFFLHLVKQRRGESAIDGIIITLAVPEMTKYDTKQYQSCLHRLASRLAELKTIFPYPLPCQLIITKCDLLVGFNEFFAETTEDESQQMFGIRLPEPTKEINIHQLVMEQFNALIKQLNSQLLWRLHQERNPMLRPFIKDFPLQIEKMKEQIIDILKKCPAIHQSLLLQGIYLTSAQQPPKEWQPDVLINIGPQTETSLQLFKPPTPSSRPYFIRQFFTHKFSQALAHKKSNDIISSPPWKKIIAYGLSILVVTGSILFFSYDFKRGMEYNNNLQQQIVHYQETITQIADANDRFISTLNLLNELHQTALQARVKFNVHDLLSFYSFKAQQKTVFIYQQALQHVFLPEVNRYLEEYLKIPVNRDASDLYGALKAYLMLHDPSQMDATFIAQMIKQLSPTTMPQQYLAAVDQHVAAATANTLDLAPLNMSLVTTARQYLMSIPGARLSFIILKHINHNNLPKDIKLANEGDSHSLIFRSKIVNQQISAMYTAAEYPHIISQDLAQAVDETIMGNWVLSNRIAYPLTLAEKNTIVQELQSHYISQYVDLWERLIDNLQITKPANLKDTDKLLVTLISDGSPLLQVLQTIHENTYFDPVAKASPKLMNISALMDSKNPAQMLIYQTLAHLQALHNYLQPVITAHNSKKAAFELMSYRVQHNSTPDPITSLHLFAQKTPDPIKGWLDDIANHAWHYLMNDASLYLDTSWKNQVNHFYQTQLANYYPFNKKSPQEVDIEKFSQFFSSKGIVLGFYQQYLEPLIDASTPKWRWKKIDNENSLPFNEEALQQIQQAIQVQQNFFADNALIPNLEFTLQPYEFGKDIKQVKIIANNKPFHDDISKLSTTEPPSHVITWPSTQEKGHTAIQVTLDNHEVIQRQYPGHWGWFKFINQSIDSVISKKKMLVNFSADQHPVRYVLTSSNKMSPYFVSTLNHFRLSTSLLKTQTQETFS